MKTGGVDASSSENDDDLEEEMEGNTGFVNPLLAGKKQKKAAGESGSEEDEEEVEAEESWSDDDAEETKKDKDKKDKMAKLELLGKRKRSSGGDGLKSFFNEVIEEVPANDPGTLAEKGYDSDDSQDIAEIRVLAKKMLRKKDRDTIIEDSYNRYAFNDDTAKLPSWFQEDEARAWRPNINLTKEEVQVEKDAIKVYNARPSKKVEEAKARKKKKLGRAMEKIKKKATVIADQDLNEASKMRQIQKLYRNEKKKHKESTTYTVNKNFKQSSGTLKAGRNVKFVDSRMKKDLKRQKHKAKKAGKSKGQLRQPKK
jgi:AdoMet-dependent rRNA methyltransferase SPB1